MTTIEQHYNRLRLRLLSMRSAVADARDTDIYDTKGETYLRSPAQNALAKAIAEAQSRASDLAWPALRQAQALEGMEIKDAPPAHVDANSTWPAVWRAPTGPDNAVIAYMNALRKARADAIDFFESNEVRAAEKEFETYRIAVAQGVAVPPVL